jgi:hypothetical protein
MSDFLSIIFCKVKTSDLEKIQKAQSNLQMTNYEIIITNPIGWANTDFKNSITNKMINTFYYEFNEERDDRLMTKGIDLSLGSKILEFYNCENFNEIFGEINSKLENVNTNTIFASKRRNSVDRLLSAVIGLTLKQKISTLYDTPRFYTSESIKFWNSIKSKDKVLKFSVFLQKQKVNYVFLESDLKVNRKRHIREVLRNILYTSVAPLRLVTLFSFMGAFVSLSISVYVYFYSIYNKVIEGWTSTNLLISFSTFSILICLATLSEYLIQIITNTRYNYDVNILTEFSSNSKTYKNSFNSEEVE